MLTFYISSKRGKVRRKAEMLSDRQKDTIQSSTNTPATSTKPKRTLKLRNLAAQSVLVLLFGIGFFLSMTPSGRATTRAALLLPSLITASELESMRLIHEPARRTQMIIPSRNGLVSLDVYAPTSPTSPIPGVRGGIVIIPGVGDNRKVPQLVNFSQSLAQVGLVVMVMTTPTLIKYDIAVQDSDGVVETFKALARWPGVGTDRIGIVSFSAGAPLACFAAVDPRIRDQLAFVALFGGYFDATTLLRAFGQRAIIVDGRKQTWQPQIVPMQTLSNVITRTLLPSERTLLVNSFALSGRRPLSTNELARLSPAGAAAYHLLAGDQPSQVDANLASLSPQMREQLTELSPGRVVSGIRAPIYLLHDRADDSIPFTESRDFAAALMRLGHPHDFTEFGIFHHVQVRPDIGVELLGDVLEIFRILRGVLLVSS
jgi:acetyl esterase/lipase